MIYELISKVLINVLLISIFICIFFFTYGAYLEKQVILKQMNILGNNLMNTIELTGETTNTQLYDFVDKKLLSPSNLEEISSKDAEVLASNKPIINKVILYIIIFFLVICGIVIYIYFLSKSGKELDIKEILIESSVILIFIGLTEFAFLNFFGSKFVSINTNSVKSEVFKSLQTYSNALNDIPISTS